MLRQRRIDRNEAEIRKIDRTLAQHEIATKKPEAAARFGVHPLQDSHLEQLRASRAELADQVAHDKAQIEASGHKTFTAADLKPGDVIKYRGRTHVVKKVNKTTVSVPTGYSWDDKVPINQITGHVKHDTLTPEQQAKAKQIANLTADPVHVVDLAWNEQLHPRNPKGSKGGGKFTAKNSSSAPPADMTANVRDFQRRNGLPGTGVVDAATAAKIRATLAAKGGSGKGRKKKAKKTAARKAAAVTRQQIGQHVATLNSMTPGQRAAARTRMPIPPTGYVWTATNQLRAVAKTRAQRTAPPVGL